MAKVKFEMEFDNEDKFDRQTLIRAVKADDAYSTLWDVAQEIFRPHRKHGYSHRKLQELIDNDNNNCDNGILEAISILEEMFYEILQENGINLDKEWS